MFRPSSISRNWPLLASLAIIPKSNWEVSISFIYMSPSILAMYKAEPSVKSSEESGLKPIVSVQSALTTGIGVSVTMLSASVVVIL